MEVLVVYNLYGMGGAQWRHERLSPLRHCMYAVRWRGRSSRNKDEVERAWHELMAGTRSIGSSGDGGNAATPAASVVTSSVNGSVNGHGVADSNYMFRTVRLG